MNRKIKSGLYVGLLGFGFCITSACTNQELSSKHLTDVPVVRKTSQQTGNHTEKKQNTATENTAAKPVVSTKPYYIIVASFGAEQRTQAGAYRNNLKNKGYQAILLENGNRIRVSIYNADTEEKAMQKRDQYRRELNIPDIWVLQQ